MKTMTPRVIFFFFKTVSDVSTWSQLAFLLCSVKQGHLYLCRQYFSGRSRAARVRGLHGRTEKTLVSLVPSLEVIYQHKAHYQHYMV